MRLFGTHHRKNLNGDRPTLSVAEMSASDSSFSVSGHIRFMQIFAGVLWRGASNDSAWSNMETSIFRTFGRLRTLGNEANLIVAYSIIWSHCRLSSDPEIHDLE